MQYDVALSFAGEDREYVDQVANHLRRAGVQVFYDKYEEVDLWGKDLYEHLSEVYGNSARYTVMFISGFYASKLWPRHERRSAQARAFSEHREYILPARFDDTEVPGLLETTHYLDLRERTPEQLAGNICEKLVRSGISLAAEPSPSSGTEVPAASAIVVTVTVSGVDGTSIEGAEVFLVASNGTHLQNVTDSMGTAPFEVTKRRTLTVFCAHPQRVAFVVQEFDPVRDLKIILAERPGVGSRIAIRSWVPVPGLRGSMNPIHDASNRLYVYTRNIAVDGGALQPVPFGVGQRLHFEDADGSQGFVTFVAVIADCFLIEHQAT